MGPAVSGTGQKGTSTDAKALCRLLCCMLPESQGTDRMTSSDQGRRLFQSPAVQGVKEKPQEDASAGAWKRDMGIRSCPEGFYRNEAAHIPGHQGPLCWHKGTETRDR